MTFRLQAISLGESFRPNSSGRRERQLVLQSGGTALDEAAWEAGAEAFDFLQSVLGDPTLCADDLEFVAGQFLKFFRELWPSLQSKESGELVALASRHSFDEFTADRDWVELLLIVHPVVLPAILAGEADVPDEGDLTPFDLDVAAAIIQRLDDAAISEFVDGRGIGANLIDVGILLGHLRGSRVRKSHAALFIGGEARRRAILGHSSGPKADAKRYVFERWQEWQKEPRQYRSTARFAVAMLDKLPDQLSSTQVVERWARTWRRDQSAESNR